MKSRVRSRGQRRTPASSRALLLLAIVLCALHSCPVGAGVFGRNKKEPVDGGSSAEVEAKAEAATGETTTAAADIAEAEENTETTGETTGEGQSSPTSEPARPSTILEAEARTARELGHAVRRLSRDLDACRERSDALEEGFQSLYSAHLGSVDGLRKCREGIALPEGEWERLTRAGGLDSVVDEAILREAREGEDRRRRDAIDAELASRHRDLIRSLEERVESLVRRERSWERTISELQARRDLLEKREGAWERTIGDLMGEIEVRARREAWWEEMKAEMEGRIGTLSRLAVVERFGPGPHHVSMTVLLDEGNPSSQRTIVFQLAPLDLVPHSVHLFLSQIAEGHWSRGTPAIVLNAEHVLQACPHPCLDGVDLGGRLEGYPYEDMRAAGLDAVSFQEYSPLFPHERYTIGFAGRPHSGPEFYVNLIDNTLDHGSLEERKRRMGASAYRDWAEEAFGGEEEADEEAMAAPYPCFGKVVEGFDVVDEIASGLTRASLPRDDDSEDEDDFGDVEPELDESILLRPVKITSMNILEDYIPGVTKEEEKEETDVDSKTSNDEL